MNRAGIALLAFCILFIFVCLDPINGSKLNFNYECVGKGATVSTYSYLHEPRIEESSFESGLKSGSFNYLEDGSVDLKETISYYYGNGTNTSNSTVKHNLNVEFDGKRGISEFFGRGFFKNNRFISAWKKIRYDESQLMKTNGIKWENRSSNYINVEAEARMKTIENGTSFKFKYHADVEDGVIETRDDAGWTNRTGPRKYDWESESKSSGDLLNVTNDLSDTEPFEVAAGPLGDWLPCCYSGTTPTITMRHDVDYPWPSDVTIATLEANRVLPTRSLSTAYSIPSNDSPTYWKREIQIGLSSRPSVPVYRAEVSAIGLRKAAQPEQGGIVALKANQLLPTMHLSTAYAPLISHPVYLKREAQVGLRSLLPAVVPVQMTANSSPPVQSQEKTGGSLFASVPLQNPANCIGENCPANFFASKSQKNLTCKEGACEGYECIYEYDDEPTSSSFGVTIPEGSTRDIALYVDVFEHKNATNATTNFEPKSEEKAKYVIYKITTENSGDVQIDKVILSAEFASGMKFKNTSYLDPQRGKPLVKVDPVTYEENQETNVRWDLGSLSSGEIKSVILACYLKPDVEASNVGVTVTGITIDGTEVTDSQRMANKITECGFFIVSGKNRGRPCKEATKEEYEGGCEQVCPGWIESYMEEPFSSP